jgi:hypothetical protein
MGETPEMVAEARVRRRRFGPAGRSPDGLPEPLREMDSGRGDFARTGLPARRLRRVLAMGRGTLAEGAKHEKRAAQGSSGSPALVGLSHNVYYDKLCLRRDRLPEYEFGAPLVEARRPDDESAGYSAAALAAAAWRGCMMQ